MLPFSVEEKAYITEAFNSISTCLDDLLIVINGFENLLMKFIL